MKSIRTIVEIIVRGRAIKRHMEVSGKTVPLYVTPEAQLKYLKRKFDLDLIELAEAHVHPGHVVWDIGGNCGVFALAAAARSLTGIVVCVEPDIFLANLIKRSAKLPANRDRDIRVLPVAISDEIGMAEFVIAERGRASNHLMSVSGRSQAGGIRKVDYTPTFTLDQILDFFPRPDFVKIDIEGAELIALEGGEKLISEVRPKWYIEVGDDVSDRVRDLFFRYGYREKSALGNNILFTPDEP